MITQMVGALTVGVANAIETAVYRSSRNSGRLVSRRILSGDVADQLVEALRFRRAQVTQLEAENRELRLELDAAHRVFARTQTKAG